jgi:hypothetical protein
MDKQDLTPSQAELDAHGFDPHDFEWFAVPRRPRADGWTPHAQRSFIEALADTGSVTMAARAVTRTVQSAYRLRRAPGAESFAAAWDAAIAQASKKLVDIAFDRAINGVEHQQVDGEGNLLWAHTRYNDRLLMFLLRAHHPGRYGGVEGRRMAPTPPDPQPVDATIEALAPVTPPDPHRLMAPDDLANLIATIAEPEPEPVPASPPPATPPPAKKTKSRASRA